MHADDPARVEAGRGLTRQIAQGHALAVQRFLDELETWEEPWRRTATVSDRGLRLTPVQLGQLVAEVGELLDRYKADEAGGDGAERVKVIFDAFPQRGEAL